MLKMAFKQILVSFLQTLFESFPKLHHKTIALQCGVKLPQHCQTATNPPAPGLIMSVSNVI